jgi:hypothetical protein
MRLVRLVPDDDVVDRGVLLEKPGDVPAELLSSLGSQRRRGAGDAVHRKDGTEVALRQEHADELGFVGRIEARLARPPRERDAEGLGAEAPRERHRLCRTAAERSRVAEADEEAVSRRRSGRLPIRACPAEGGRDHGGAHDGEHEKNDDPAQGGPPSPVGAPRLPRAGAARNGI